MTYWFVYVHMCGFGRIYAKFCEIRVLYFRASLRLANAKNAEEKSQMRIVFKKSEREGKDGRETLWKLRGILMFAVYDSRIYRIRQGSLVCLSDIGPSEKFRPFSVSNSHTMIANNCLLEPWKLMHKCDKRKIVLLSSSVIELIYYVLICDTIMWIANVCLRVCISSGLSILVKYSSFRDSKAWLM